MGQFIPIALAVAGTAMQQQETQNVLRKQDEATAQGLLSQSRKQQDVDRRVNDEISNVAASTAQDERDQRLGQYMETLRRGQRQTDGSFGSPVGGAAFQADSAAARTGAADSAQTTAGLMSRIDAPQMQRQGEAFGYGNLATDIGLAARESAGQRYIDQLRLRQIRRRPEVDLIAGGLTAAGGAMAGGGGMAGAASSPQLGANYYGVYDPMTMGRA